MSHCAVAPRAYVQDRGVSVAAGTMGHILRQTPLRSRLAAVTPSSTQKPLIKCSRCFQADQRRQHVAAAGAVAPGSLEAIIADVLNANRAPLLRPADLLDLIDASGNGLTTTISRSWDCTGAGLALEGQWHGCSEARRMAMLAVYQVRSAWLAGLRTER